MFVTALHTAIENKYNRHQFNNFFYPHTFIYISKSLVLLALQAMHKWVS